jgi:hypothetical protein
LYGPRSFVALKPSRQGPLPIYPSSSSTIDQLSTAKALGLAIRTDRMRFFACGVWMCARDAHWSCNSPKLLAIQKTPLKSTLESPRKWRVSNGLPDRYGASWRINTMPLGSCDWRQAARIAAATDIANIDKCAMSVPSSSSWVAKLCRSVCVETPTSTPLDARNPLSALLSPTRVPSTDAA